MSEVKFTKGPWTVGNTDVYCEITNSEDRTIADTCATSCSGDFEAGLANACLIAAAPEMYEMLEWLRDSFCEADSSDCTWFEIEKLLAKARGETT